MKKIFLQTALCVLVSISLSVNFAAAQATEKIHHFEYFFDTDPGFGNAISVPVPTPAITVNNLNFTPNIAALANGLHTLNIRGIDSSYRWSHSRAQLFYKETVVLNPVVPVIKAEYFFDTDPGFGNGMPAAASGATVTFNFSGNISSLGTGLHNLFVRTLDASGNWSITAPQLFYKEALSGSTTPNISSAEYFFDIDPGVGNAVAATITAGQIVTFNFTGNIAPLTNGLHRLFVRTRDANGNWSHTISQLFYKQAVTSNPVANITSAEYFFDADPGFGNATAASVAAGAAVTINFTGSIAALSNGLHNLFVRTRDANGRWSITAPQLFYKEAVSSNPIPNITSAEYFFDNDPGFGNATAASVTAGTTVTISFTGSIAALSNGLHNLFVRTRDANGKWSMSVPQLFYKEAVSSNPVPNITSAEYFFDTDPGFGNALPANVTAGINVTVNFAGNISALSNGLHYLYVRTRDANGKWSLSLPQLFYKEPVNSNPVPNITAAEYYVDTDPGFGSGTAFTVSPQGQTIIQNVNLSATSLTKGLHRLYIRVKDAAGKWSITNTHLFYYETALPVPPTDQFVKLEWFWNNDPGFGNANAVSIPPGNNGQITNFAFNVSVPPAFSNTKQNLFIRVLDDWSLTTVRVVNFAGIVLPVTLLEFTAVAQQNTVLTKWATSQELNSDYFEAEHSTDGVNFKKFGKVTAKGNSSMQSLYELRHYDPVTGSNYYRLKQVDKDGKFEYSPVVRIMFSAKGTIVAYPNPVSDKLNVTVPQTLVNETVMLQVFDIRGTVIIQTTVTGRRTEIPMASLAAGSYTLVVRNKEGKVMDQQIIIKQ